MKTRYKFIILIIIACLSSVLIYNSTKQFTGKVAIHTKNRIVSYLKTKDYNCEDYICVSNNNITVDLKNLKYEKIYSEYDLKLTYDINIDTGAFKNNGYDAITYNFTTLEFVCNESSLTCILVKSDLVDLKKEFTNLLANLKLKISNIKDKNQD